MEERKINPEFQDLGSPESFKNHIKEITKDNLITPHFEILDELIKHIKPIDFKTLSNPQNIENFKIDCPFEFKHSSPCKVNSSPLVS